MNILALETSSPVLSVALKKGDGAIAEESIEGFLTHAENLLPMMDRLLQKEGLSIREVDAFAIGRGPGSFTGLRIGFAALKGFLACQKKDCCGAMSLDTIAENADLEEGTRLGVCLDAKREKIYARFYRRRKGRWTAEGKARVLSPQEFSRRLSDGIFLAGDAISRYKNLFGPKRKFSLLPETTWYPKARTMIAWLEKWDKKLGKLEKPADFLPLYFRLSEAEERAHARPH